MVAPAQFRENVVTYLFSRRIYVHWNHSSNVRDQRELKKGRVREREREGLIFWLWLENPNIITEQKK